MHTGTYTEIFVLYAHMKFTAEPIGPQDIRVSVDNSM